MVPGGFSNYSRVGPEIIVTGYRLYNRYISLYNNTDNNTTSWCLSIFTGPVVNIR